MRRSSRLRPFRFAALSVRVTIAVVVLAACATQNTAPQNEPEIRISQLSNISDAARHISGGISVQYQIDVTNHAHDPITLRRVDLISLGAGAYTLRPTSYPVDKMLIAGETTSLQFWVPANIDDPTIVGANGPVSVRLTLQYDTPAGRTQSIVVQQVHGLAGVN